MKPVRLIAVALGLLVASPGSGSATGQERASLQTIRSGDYQPAIDYLDGELRLGRATAQQTRWLGDVLIEVGRYDDAIEAMDRFGAVGPAYETANRRGEALRGRGRLEEAASAFRLAVSEGAADAVVARLNLAVLDFEAGRRAEAMVGFDWFIDFYNSAASADSEQLTAVGVACSYLGIDEPQLFHDAVRAFEEAIAADPGNPEPRLLLGELFLDKYNSGEARGLIQDVLKINSGHPRALLAEARRLHFDGSPEATERARQALIENPNLVSARAFMAKLLLAGEQWEAAVAEAEHGLAVNPASLPVLSMLAAARYLQRDMAEFDRLAERALSLNPRYGELYRQVAEMAVQNRLYVEAVELATRAVELDPSNWASHGTLGINQLRIGQIEAGRVSLERAFGGDPFNVWFKNTLDLIDTYADYETVPSQRTDLFIESEIADLLALYMGPLADEAIETLSARYSTQPESRVRVEVYRRHADFSVRTVGLAGLGALGVAFGPVIAVDAPMAPGMGEFNWGATLWHEIAHVITLGATDNRVPRWLTEGLSVFEERRARPGWGDEVTPDFLMAWLEDKLHPVSKINDGFVRPSYPQHVSHSYLQASLVCELIEQEHGFEAIRRILRGYRAGHSTPEIVRQVLGLSESELDARFVGWLEARYAGQLNSLRPALARRVEVGPAAGSEVPTESLEALVEQDPDDFMALLQLGARYYELGRDVAAVPHLERAKALFPEHVGGGSAYGFLARIHQQQGNATAAVAELRELTARDGSSYNGNVKLAEMLEAAGEPRGAAEALTRALFVNPFDPGLHGHLADLWAGLERWDAEVVERRAVVALNPVARAEALYLLARAQLRAGDARGARRSILGSLEIAPAYPAAQELLLELRRTREGTS